MDFFISIIIFIIVFFAYIHISSQLKMCEDLEIFEMDYINNSQLQEICELKQPMLFNYSSVNPSFFENISLDKLSNHETNDLKIKESSDYWNENILTVESIPLPYKSSLSLFATDTHSNYFSENNEDFIDESGLRNVFADNNLYLKPTFNVFTKYDICTGSANTCTPMRYHTNFRHFICAMSGKIQIKMTPFKSTKYLNCIKDYDSYEFRSPINVWKPQSEYLDSMEKIMFLEFQIPVGFALYIPPYWWYSIKYAGDTKHLTCNFTYNSFVNSIINVPNYAKYFVQQQNVTKKNVKTLDLHKSEEVVVPVDEPEQTETDAEKIGLKTVPSV